MLGAQVFADAAAAILQGGVSDMPIVVQELLRGLFYAPYYAALALGAYEQEGVEVRFVSAPTPGQAPDGLFDGTVDVAWGGPMRVNQMYEAAARLRPRLLRRGGDARPVHADRPRAAARISACESLPQARIAHGQRGADPVAVLAGGSAPRRARPRRRCTGSPTARWPENIGGPARGALDVVQLFQPFAEELIASGEGHLWYAAADRGPCSYTSFYARRGTLAAKRREMLKLVRALYRTQKWLHLQPPDALAERRRAVFPGCVAPAARSPRSAATTISASGGATRSCRAGATSVSSPALSRAASSAALRSRPRSTTASPSEQSPTTRHLLARGLSL